MVLKNMVNNIQREDKSVVIAKLDAFLEMQSGQKSSYKTVSFHPSGISACSRLIVFEWLNAPSDEDSIAPRIQRIFDVGNDAHKRICGYLREMGVLVVEEMKIKDEEHTISGKCDGIIKVQRHFVLEIKSMNTHRFEALKEPKKEHLEQLQVYLYLVEKLRQKIRQELEVEGKAFLFNGKRELTRTEEVLVEIEEPITQGILLYENKNDQSLKEFVVERDEKIISALLDKIAKIQDYLDRKELPIKVCTSPKSYSARYCPYRNICFSGRTFAQIETLGKVESETKESKEKVEVKNGGKGAVSEAKGTGED